MDVKGQIEAVVPSAEAAAISPLGLAITGLRAGMRQAVQAIAERRQTSPEEALAGAIYRQASLDRIRDAGWRLLVESDGDIRELSEV